MSNSNPNPNPIKDDDVDVVKEAHLKRIAELSELAKAEQDEKWAERGGNFGTKTFGVVDVDGDGDESYSECNS